MIGKTYYFSTVTMNRLLLIDAYAMIYRAYYAFIRVPRINSKGENTSAVFGFVITLEDLIKRVKPTHIAVAFDPHGPTFRHEAYSQYKAQREETPEDIRKAVPVIKDILAAMNIPVVEVSGFEADDVIGTLSVQAADSGTEVFMATPDKDYGQLVTDRIHQYRPRHTGGFEQMGPKEVCDKYGLSNPLQVIDLLALMGDASDNIPGCKGVGEKTAVQLISQFGSVENLLENTAQLKGALKTKVESQAEEIRFSKFLATIRTDVPVTWTPAAFVFKDNKNWDALTPLYQQLEFNSLLKQKPEEPAPAKSNQQQEMTLDLFAADNGSSATATAPKPAYDTIENRLCSYLLNPELAFNPYKEPDWDALKADSALWKLYNEVELPLVEVLRDMEKAGVRVDTSLLKEAEASLTQELEALEQDIYNLAGETFNINSPAQVGEVLFSHLHLDPKAKRGKNG